MLSCPMPPGGKKQLDGIKNDGDTLTVFGRRSGAIGQNTELLPPKRDDIVAADNKETTGGMKQPSNSGTSSPSPPTSESSVDGEFYLRKTVQNTKPLFSKCESIFNYIYVLLLNFSFAGGCAHVYHESLTTLHEESDDQRCDGTTPQSAASLHNASSIASPPPPSTSSNGGEKHKRKSVENRVKGEEVETDIDSVESWRKGSSGSAGVQRF